MRKWIFVTSGVLLFLMLGFGLGWGEALLSAASGWLGWEVKAAKDKGWRKWDG